MSWQHDMHKLSAGDFLFVLSFSQIVTEEKLALFRHNLVVHASDLPKGRGMSPWTWQIIEGKNQIPIVLFEADTELDQGNIYLSDTLDFDGTELVVELRQQVVDKTIKLCSEFIRGYPDIVSHGKVQSGDASYYRRRNPEDSRLSVDKTIREQFNLLRVVDNKKYPAFFDFNGHRYVLSINKLENMEE